MHGKDLGSKVQGSRHRKGIMKLLLELVRLASESAGVWPAHDILHCLIMASSHRHGGL